MGRKIGIIIGSILIAILIIGLLIPEKKEWHEEIGEQKIYSVTKEFLKTKVNNPETFEFTEYPDFEYGSEEERIVVVKGYFKCANSYGVYKKYRFSVTLQIKDKWIVKNYKIT